MHLICDRSRSYNKADMMQAFMTGKRKSVIDVHYMPTASVKYISPLYKKISSAYRKCAITYGTDVFYDQPST